MFKQVKLDYNVEKRLKMALNSLSLSLSLSLFLSLRYLVLRFLANPIKREGRKRGWRYF